MKSMRLLLLLVALLSLPALACDFVTGQAQPTQTPFPTQTPPPASPAETPAVMDTPQAEAATTPEAVTPEVTVNFVSHEDEREGIHVQYPESWYLEDTFFLTISDSPDAAAGLDRVADNSVVIIFAGPVDELPSTDPEEAVMQMVEDFELADDMEIIEGPRRHEIHGEEAATVVVRGTSEQQTRFVALMTIIIGRERAAVIIATTPENRAAADRPILEAIANSVRLFTPTVVEDDLDEGFIGYDETITGSVATDTSARWFFTGNEDDVVTIVVEPEGTFDVVVDLQDEFGLSLLPGGPVDQSFGTERITNFRLPHTGDYFIVVRGYAGSAGEYSVALSRGGIVGIDLPGSTLVITPTLAEDGQHAYPFEAAAGAILELIVEPEGDLDVVLEIYRDFGGEDDELIVSVDHSFGTEELEFEVPEDGNYYVLVRGFAGEAGTYELTMTAGVDIIFELAVRDLVYGYVGEEGYLDYMINGRDGESVTLTVESGEELDAVIEIVDLEGTIVAAVDDGFTGEAETLTYTFTADALYLIRVRSFMGTPGSFVMAIE
jgi:hypothetical protein